MKKNVIIAIVSIIVLAYGVACCGNEMRVNRNTRGVAAYVYGAVKNGALTPGEARSLASRLHYCVWVPAYVRSQRAEEVRRIVDYAYEQQRQSDNDGTYCALK